MMDWTNIWYDEMKAALPELHLLIAPNRSVATACRPCELRRASWPCELAVRAAPCELAVLSVAVRAPAVSRPCAGRVRAPCWPCAGPLLAEC